MLARRLPEIEFDLSLEDFGDAPIGLGQISTNPAIIMVGGFLAVFLGIAAIPGLGGLGLAALGLLATANDLKHTRSKDTARPKLKPGDLNENPNLPPPIDVAADSIPDMVPRVPYSAQPEYKEPNPWESSVKPDPPDIQAEDLSALSWEVKIQRECEAHGITFEQYRAISEQVPGSTVEQVATLLLMPSPVPSPPLAPTYKSLVSPSGEPSEVTSEKRGEVFGGATGERRGEVSAIAPSPAAVERFKAMVESRAPLTIPDNWNVKGSAYHVIRQAALYGCSKNWITAQFGIVKNSAPYRELSRIYDDARLTN